MSLRQLFQDRKSHQEGSQGDGGMIA